MGLFMSKSDVVYGAIIDIGSGSVMAALVCSVAGKPHPDIIWSKREYIPLLPDSTDSSAKRVLSSLLNVMLALETEGKNALSEKFSNVSITALQVTIAAPWSYTVTKTISYKQDLAFDVTSSLVEELLQTAQKRVNEELEVNERTRQLGLGIINRYTLGVQANDYRFRLGNKQEANSLKVIECSAIAHEFLIDAISEIKEKVLPKAVMKQYSFMLCFYRLQQEIAPGTEDTCLVDITYESTEIGIVRDGFLQYCTHTPTGVYTLARSIGEALKIPYGEAFGILNSPDFDSKLSLYSAAQQEAALSVLSEYEDQLVKLLQETGDQLTIPKLLYIHGNLRSENIFIIYFEQASKRATKSNHYIQPVTEILVNKIFPKETTPPSAQPYQDTAMLLTAQFFHTECQSTRPKV